MPKDLVLKELKLKNSKNIFRLLILIAAVLKGCKISNMIFVSLDELKFLIKALEKTNLKIALLYQLDSKYLLLIYRKSSLEEYLNKSDSVSFLSSCGYDAFCLKAYFSKLKKRIKASRDLKLGFPHEVGIFLGYPLCDIEGFKKYNGKSYLHSGYWKVYDNLDMALEKFKQIDRAKDQAISEWLLGRTFSEIAC